MDPIDEDRQLLVVEFDGDGHDRGLDRVEVLDVVALRVIVYAQVEEVELVVFFQGQPLFGGSDVDGNQGLGIYVVIYI